MRKKCKNVKALFGLWPAEWCAVCIVLFPERMCMSGYFGCVMQRGPPANAHGFGRDAGCVSFDVVADSSRDATVVADGCVLSGPRVDTYSRETPSKFPELPVCCAGPGRLP